MGGAGEGVWRVAGKKNHSFFGYQIFLGIPRKQLVQNQKIGKSTKSTTNNPSIPSIRPLVCVCVRHARKVCVP